MNTEKLKDSKFRKSVITIIITLLLVLGGAFGYTSIPEEIITVITTKVNTVIEEVLSIKDIIINNKSTNEPVVVTNSEKQTEK